MASAGYGSCAQHSLDGVTYGAERGVVERAFREDGREAGGDEQAIPLAERHVQLFGQVQHHVPARLRSP